MILRAAARRRSGAVALGFLLLLAGCAAPPPPPPPTIVDLTLSTGTDANPTTSGQGAPVVVRVYQLGSAAGFEKAEFFRLLNQDSATLGADLVNKDEFLLAPGSARKLNLTPPPTVKAIGVFAAYRDFQKVTWRGTAEVPANKTTNVAVRADAAGLSVAASPAPPPPPPKPAS